MKTHKIEIQGAETWTSCGRLVVDGQQRLPKFNVREAFIAVNDWVDVDCVDCLKKKPIEMVDNSHPMLAKNLRNRRKSYPRGPGPFGLTLGDLANISGVSKSQIWVIENTNASPSTNTIMKLANALDTTVHALLGIPEIGNLETQDQVFIRQYMELNDIEKIYARAICKVFHHKSIRT